MCQTRTKANPHRSTNRKTSSRLINTAPNLATEEYDDEDDVKEAEADDDKGGNASDEAMPASRFDCHSSAKFDLRLSEQQSKNEPTTF